MVKINNKELSIDELYQEMENMGPEELAAVIKENNFESDFLKRYQQQSDAINNPHIRKIIKTRKHSVSIWMFLSFMSIVATIYGAFLSTKLAFTFYADVGFLNSFSHRPSIGEIWGMAGPMIIGGGVQLAIILINTLVNTPRKWMAKAQRTEAQFVNVQVLRTFGTSFIDACAARSIGPEEIKNLSNAKITIIRILLMTLSSWVFFFYPRTIWWLGDVSVLATQIGLVATVLGVTLLYKVLVMEAAAKTSLGTH